MFHATRCWAIREPTTFEEAAAVLKQFDSMVTCTAFHFEHEGQTFLMLNDSTGPDGLQEYAVVHVTKKGPSERRWQGVQIESLTTTWIVQTGAHQLVKLLRRIIEATSPDDRGMAMAVDFAVDTDPEHRCMRCA